ncbi:uncharacterized protein LOC112679971 [Sipha flava]|uniref:Uncharacterized protein LOC112679971 n=2 Tax=Sipha flava TaxID=143950 RepID=A0A8B8F501_9HEMI|nr:uncharacterized protein LOC112679971 [Sipha flava]
MFVQKASDVLNMVTEQELPKHTDALLAVLVQAVRGDESYVGPITNLIVKKAVRDPDSSGLYACLCSDAVTKASKTRYFAVVHDVFIKKMKTSCLRALRDLPKTYDPTTGSQTEYSVSKKVRVRTMETCRFIGWLFMLNKFKMSHTVKKTVSGLLASGDAHCLECLCALLQIIGPRFEMVDQVSKHCSAGKVYKTLEKYAGNGMQPARTVRRINRIILERNYNWLVRKPSSLQYQY